jgi:hypothetical protein
LIEHAGKAIDALKSKPVILAALIFNGMILAAVYFAVEASRQQQHDELMLVLERCIK